MHICYQGRHWNHGSLKELRNHPYFIVSIPRDTVHRSIHEWLTDIPAPSEENAAEALKQFRMLEDHKVVHDTDQFAYRLLILIALFDCVEQPTADAFRKQLDILYAYIGKPP